MANVRTTHSTTDQIAADARRLGVSEGDNVLVHASLRSLGSLPGGAENVIAGLLEALGKTGTLLLPALSYATVNRDQPVFDLLKTPSCVGALTEYFRLRPGTIRSVHPTHSVCAVGNHAERLLDGHVNDHTPCGRHSPFYKLNEFGGRILFLGCGMNPNTSMHAVEELIEPEYLFSDSVEYQIVLPENCEIRTKIRRHDFKNWAQAYGRLENVLDHHALRRGNILTAVCHLVDVKAMWREALRMMKANPLYFVERMN